MSNNHSINKGYFSGKFILRVWGRDGETLHNSAHDLPEQARAALTEYNNQMKEQRSRNARTASA